MCFIRLNLICYLGLSLSGLSCAWGEVFTLPPNEQVSICGDTSLPTKQVCRLITRDNRRVDQYEISNIVSFLSVKNTVKLNGFNLPEGTLMTLVTSNDPENNFEIELESKGQLDVYNDSNLFLTLQCDKV